MTLRYTLFLLCAVSLGCVTPTYASDIISCDSFENCPDDSVPVTNALLALEARMDALEAENEALKALLVGVSRLVDDNTGQDTLRFTNMNVQVVSGSGATDGLPTGTGNLIIGYNEKRESGDDRTGSHMLVIGRMNNYSFFGGMVVGDQNETSQRYASVSGGAYNIASGQSASVSGGSFNEASGSNASISGGSSNSASSLYASVSGGEGNTASGEAASISGGQFKTANPDYSYAPIAPDLSGEVAANTNAIAAIGPHSPDFSTLLGGVSRITDPNTDQDTLRFTNMNVQVVSGSGATDGTKTGTGNLIVGYNELRGIDDDRTGSHMLVVGRKHTYSSFGGVIVGDENATTGAFASVSGGHNNSADGQSASVSGGNQSSAIGDYSSVSGGQINAALGAYSSISGGSTGITRSGFSTVSGGELNEAAAPFSSVSGGRGNTASGEGASVSGGNGKTADVVECTVAGNVGTDCVP